MKQPGTRGAVGDKVEADVSEEELGITHTPQESKSGTITLNREEVQ